MDGLKATADISREFDNAIFRRFHGDDFGKVCRAASIAYTAHEGKFRKNGYQPYMVHPLRVALLLMHEFCCYDVDMVCAALLHDVLEDASDLVSAEDIRKDFGDEVSDLVEAVTFVPGDVREWAMAAREKARKAQEAGNRAMLLKMADRIDNLRDLASLDPKDAQDARFIKTYIEETNQHFLPLADYSRNQLAMAMMLKAMEPYDP